MLTLCHRCKACIESGRARTAAERNYRLARSCFPDAAFNDQGALADASADDEVISYHELQRGDLCGLQAINNLFQKVIASPDLVAKMASQLKERAVEERRCLDTSRSTGTRLTGQAQLQR